MLEAPPPAAEPIGFVGLGNMGGPMVRRLLAAGRAVMVFDTSAPAVAAMADAGARAVADSAELAAQCSTVILMLPNSDVVDAVVGRLTAGSGEPRRLRRIVDMSSSEPLRTQALAERLDDQGITLVDAPVSGGVSGAESGELTVMVGGPDTAVDDLRPLFEELSSQVTHVGPAGAGHAVKALNNLLSAAHMIVSTEALVVAARFGVEPETVLSVVNTSSGRSGSTQTKFPRFVLPRTFDSGFTAALLEKDVGIAVGLAEALGIDVPVATSVLAGWRRAGSELPAHADHTEVVRPYESAAGVELSVGGHRRWQLPDHSSGSPGVSTGTPSPSAAGAWTDLSHRLVDDLPRVSTFPSPRYSRFLSMPEHPLNVTHVDMVVHVGTHVDAPCHFIDGGPAIDDLPVDRFAGPGIVCRVRAGDLEVYGPDALADRDAIEPGDIVLLETGWSQHFRTPRYDEHPSLSFELAHWLVDRGVKMIALDTPTPDLPVHVRPEGFTWPVHQVLLRAGVLIAEHVTNLTPLSGRRVEAVFAPLNIGGADGAPVRALARPLS
ncbi:MULTISPECIES: NAD(P)-binding domain-containing protein [unclassified Modestobacter]